MRLPVYKLRLFRSGWVGCPSLDIRYPQPAAQVFYRMIGQAPLEHAAVIFLDPFQRFMGSTSISVGDLAPVNMMPREIFKAAILANCGFRAM